MDLRERRRRAGLTQVQLARGIKCSRRYIFMLERGEVTPTKDMLVRIEAVLVRKQKQKDALYEAYVERYGN